MNVNSTGIRARRAARYMEERFNAFLSPQTFQINRDVESHWVDLSVIGERGGTEVDEALFGSVTKHVLYETPSDVLVDSPETWYGGNKCTTSNNSHPAMVFCASVRHL